MSAKGLPIIKNKKKINVKKLEKLAKEVKKIFEEEEKRLVEKGQDGAHPSTRFLLNY